MDKNKELQIKNQRDTISVQYIVAKDAKVIELKSNLKAAKRSIIGFLIIIILLSSLLISGIFFISQLTYNMQNTIADVTATQRAGLYELNKVIVKEAPSYAERLEIFCKKGKAFILQIYENDPPLEKLTQKEINEFLIFVFEFSEQYMINPWIAVSFARVESCFSKTAISYVSAKGLFQIMPDTAKLVMGADYFDGCELNLYYSTKMFFKIYLYLAAIYNNDLKWIAAAYLCGGHYPMIFYSNGRSFNEYYIWMKNSEAEIQKENPDYISQAEYMYKIENTYFSVKDL